MTYLRDEQAFVNAIIERVREKIEVLDSFQNVEVLIKPSKPLRNTNPSVWIVFESPILTAEIGFWSGKTGELNAYDPAKSQMLLGEGFYFDSVEDIDPYLQKILDLYLKSNTSG